MAGEEQRAESGGLRPAPMEQGGIRKLRIGVIFFCIAELWALVFGSCVLWFFGILRTPFLGSLAVGGVVAAISIGPGIETWLAIMSEEPILNEKGEDDSMAPFERGMWYMLPPLIASFGFIGAPARSMWVSALTSTVSLLLFARLIRRIRSVWRDYQVKVDAGEMVVS